MIGVKQVKFDKRKKWHKTNLRYFSDKRLKEMIKKGEIRQMFGLDPIKEDHAMRNCFVELEGEKIILDSILSRRQTLKCNLDFLKMNLGSPILLSRPLANIVKPGFNSLYYMNMEHNKENNFFLCNRMPDQIFGVITQEWQGDIHWCVSDEEIKLDFYTTPRIFVRTEHIKFDFQPFKIMDI